VSGAQVRDTSGLGMTWANTIWYLIGAFVGAFLWKLLTILDRGSVRPSPPRRPAETHLDLVFERMVLEAMDKGQIPIDLEVLHHALVIGAVTSEEHDELERLWDWRQWYVTRRTS
jgi:hypothetical protein